MFEGYRRGWREAGRGNDVPINRLAYACFAYCSNDEERARRGAEQLLWHISHQQDPDALSETARLQHHRKRRKGMRVGLGRYPKAPTVDAAVEAASCSPARRIRC